MGCLGRATCNMHSTLDFCPLPGRCATTQENLRAYCPITYTVQFMHFYPASQGHRKVWNFRGEGGSGNSKPLDRSQERVLPLFLPKSGGVGRELLFRFRRPCIRHHLICHGKLSVENWYWLFMFIPCPLNRLNGFPYERPRLILYLHDICSIPCECSNLDLITGQLSNLCK
jgi:hypothetical protein